MDFDSLSRVLPKSGKVLLCTHRHPDPDGLGAMVGMAYLLEKHFGLGSAMVLEGRIRRAENVAMRELLEIRALPKGGVDPAAYVGALVVDSQPHFTHTHPPGGVPILGFIDHHLGSADDSIAADEAEVPFRWVDDSYGATSTMVDHLMRHFGVEPDVRTATALFCGVRYDTNNLLRGATAFDETSFRRLEQVADRKLLGAIDQPPLPREYFRQIREALDAGEVIGPIVLTLLGEVNSPESVAEVADWFLRLKGQTWSLAGGATEGRYQVSLRSDLPDADAYPVLRFILGEQGACGGHGRMAGGQIPLTEHSLEEVQAMVRRRALEAFEQEGVPTTPLVSRAQNSGKNP